jgi:hypothetical protein
MSISQRSSSSTRTARSTCWRIPPCASCQHRSARSSSAETLDTKDSAPTRSVLMEAAARLAPRGTTLRCCCCSSSSTSCGSKASSFDTTAVTAAVVPAICGVV